MSMFENMQRRRQPQQPPSRQSFVPPAKAEAINQQMPPRPEATFGHSLAHIAITYDAAVPQPPLQIQRSAPFQAADERKPLDLGQGIQAIRQGETERSVDSLPSTAPPINLASSSVPVQRYVDFEYEEQSQSLIFFENMETPVDKYLWYDGQYYDFDESQWNALEPQFRQQFQQYGGSPTYYLQQHTSVPEEQKTVSTTQSSEQPFDATIPSLETISSATTRDWKYDLGGYWVGQTSGMIYYPPRQEKEKGLLTDKDGKPVSDTTLQEEIRALHFSERGQEELNIAKSRKRMERDLASISGRDAKKVSSQVVSDSVDSLHWLGIKWSPGKPKDGAKNAVNHWFKHSVVEGVAHNASGFDDDARTSAAIEYVQHAYKFKEQYKATKFTQKSFNNDGEESGTVDIYFSYDPKTDAATIAVWDQTCNCMRSFYDLEKSIHGGPSNKDWLIANGAPKRFLTDDAKQEEDQDDPKQEEDE